MSFKREKRQETIIYLALWIILFMAPVMSLAIRTSSNSEMVFDWSEVFVVWKRYAVFLLVFLIHNHLMAPMLVYQQKKYTYFGLLLAIIVIFQVWQCNHRPDFIDRDRGPRLERMREKPWEDDHRPDMMMDEDRRPPLPPDFKDGDFDGPRADRKRPPLIMGQHDIIALVILILMCGMNLGIKLYFKQRGDQKIMDDLEKQNLEQQLEYLKYQINPHFFMNTLNNIHALVDIDPEKAKTTILELSKMMRFVLYEGNKQGVPLDREMAFLQNYITLMKLRYTDKVSITIDVPASLPNTEVPPLMFITFVENAFKHGVSYRQESFIHIEVKADDNQLAFTCRNSRIPKEEDKHGGVGLSNVKQRLDLIYGDRYTLDINDQTDAYTVSLKIPLTI